MGFIPDGTIRAELAFISISIHPGDHLSQEDYLYS